MVRTADPTRQRRCSERCRRCSRRRVDRPARLDPVRRAPYRAPVTTPAPSDAATTPALLARLLRRRWLVVAAVWSVPALLAALETFVFWRMAGRDHPFWLAIATQAPAWLTYALLTPAIFALGRRFPLQRPRLARHAALHLSASLTAGIGYAVLATAAASAFSPVPRPMSFGRVALSWYLSALPLTTLAYFGVLGVGHALAYLAESRRRETEASRLSAQLAEARLGALRMQLHPHFLFNTLNAVTVLARDGDTRGVTRMLELLSELLREVLRSDAAHRVPLEKELAFARRYLAIEEIRFADRLRIEERVEDSARDADVPAFALQPLVENALRHGIAPRATGGTVQLGARRAGDDVELWVRDDGVGLPDDWSGADDYGVGLSNTAARLTELHGARGTLEVRRAAGGGTHVAVRLPYRSTAGTRA
jgi:signal transduction histidine kinase